MATTFKTSFDGRVAYEDIELSGIGAEDMRRAGERLLDVLPSDWKVKVTAGPYRFYSVRYEIVRDEKTVLLDFYSVRPGFDDMKALCMEVRDKLGLLADPIAGGS